MTLAFIAEKPSRWFIAQITFISVRILRGIFLVLSFGMFSTVVVLMEKKLSYRFCFAETPFK